MAGTTGRGEVGRRSFLSKLLAGSLLAGAASMVSGVVAYLFAPGEVRSSLGPARVKVDSAGGIAQGTAKLALVDGEPVWVAHLASGFVALSALCTHKGCIVKWDDLGRVFRCPCHEGLFDERGNVVSGLPRRSLSRFRVGLVGGDVYVSRGAEHEG